MDNRVIGENRAKLVPFISEEEAAEVNDLAENRKSSAGAFGIVIRLVCCL